MPRRRRSRRVRGTKRRIGVIRSRRVSRRRVRGGFNLQEHIANSREEFNNLGNTFSSTFTEAKAQAKANAEELGSNLKQKLQQFDDKLSTFIPKQPSI